MGPSGQSTEETVQYLGKILEANDMIIDGGNTKFHDDVRRAADLHPRGIHYMDAGTSGGIGGLQVGYCLMVGGKQKPVKRLAPILTTLAPEKGDGPMWGTMVLDITSRWFTMALNIV